MKIKNPVFIIGNFRGGTSILFRLLSESDELWSLYRESNHMWKKFHDHPDEVAQTLLLDESHLTNGDAPKERGYFENHYHFSAYNSYFFGYLGRVRKLREVLTPLFDLMNCFVYLFKKLFAREYRIVDKTPPNCYRVSYIEKVFPDAKFVYLTRDAKTNSSSLMNAWRNHKRFKFAHRKYLTKDKAMSIKGYEGDVWKFSNFPGWEKFLDKSLEEICAMQWLTAHEEATKAFSKMNKSKYLQLKYEDLMAKPDDYMKAICDFAQIEYSPKMRQIVHDMPLVNTDSKPDLKKEQRNKNAIIKILPIIQEMNHQLGYTD